MRTAIISDIHSNLEAFRQVLTDIDQSGVDRVVCLGDNVGYGPEPEAVVDLIRDQDIPCVMGNHELAIVEPRYQDLMNPNARESILLTQRLISAHTVNYMMGWLKGVRGLPRQFVCTWMSSRLCHNVSISSFKGKAQGHLPFHEGKNMLCGAYSQHGNHPI